MSLLLTALLAQAPLDDLMKGHRLTVVAFAASDCPASKLYRPKIERLEKAYRDRGVRFILVYANPQDTPEKAEFPTLHDKDGAIAARLGATRTTEVFVLDPAVKYRGAVDDQYGVGVQRDAERERWLVDALEALLAGKAVAVPRTEAPGCAIEARPAPATGPVTFHRDIEPILQKRCQECHRPGEAPPFALLTYEDASRVAKRIREAVTERRMPPWFAAPEHGRWSNDRRLSTTEISAIERWVDSGAPKGDAADAPAPRVFAAGWKIGKPDAVFEISSPIRVPAEGTVPYKHATVQTSFPEDRWVQAMQVRPGERGVVHHIIVFARAPGQKEKDGGLKGYFAAMAPGEETLVYPEGHAKKLPAGSTLVFQIHYTPNGKATSDRSSIGMIFATAPVKHEVKTRGIFNTSFAIPPGADNHKAWATHRFTAETRILSFFPHMHLRGKSFQFTAQPRDGEETILLDVPKYDFNWQLGYKPAEPLVMAAGTRIRAIAHFDNSAGNKANPDPTATVRYGEQTWQEMLIGYIDFVE